MNPRHVGWLVFPLFGVVLGLALRPLEMDWSHFRPVQRTRVPRKTLPLPDGSAMRFLGVPDETGIVQFWLGEREVTRVEARALGLEADGTGISAAVSLEEARTLCARLTEWSGHQIRLPSREEWRMAARGGVANAEVPWGFGLALRPDNTGFARKRPARRPGSPLGFGFRDLAGGLWEWTQEGSAVGSAWSETNPATMRLSYAVTLPEGYRDRDTGLRVLMETD